MKLSSVCLVEQRKEEAEKIVNFEKFLVKYHTRESGEFSFKTYPVGVDQHT